MHQLADEITELDKKRAEKQKKFDETKAKVVKLKAGDWSVLQEEKAQNRPEQEPRTEE